MTAKAGSPNTRIWQRLADRTRPPRKWWYPVALCRKMPRDTFAEAYRQYAETTNRTMLALLAVGTFCLLTVISTPDTALLAAGGTVKVPFAEASISFLGFVIVAPFLLTAISVYLHIFYGYWLDMEHERQEYNRILPDARNHAVERAPMLFALGDPISRGLTVFVFYWLAPGVLTAIAWKGAAVPSVGRPLVLGAGVVTAALLFLQIRRSTEPRRRVPTFVRWLLLASIGGFLASSLADFERVRRPFDLFRADLTGAYLVGQDLRGARLTEAKLTRTDLQRAMLSRADLSDADLQGVKLQAAKLQWANLQGAKLREADLRDADLQEANLSDAVLVLADLRRAILTGANLSRAELLQANLRGATLQEAILQEVNFYGADLREANLARANVRAADLAADLRGADLRGADLRNTVSLTRERVASATIDEKTKLPDGLK